MTKKFFQDTDVFLDENDDVVEETEIELGNGFAEDGEDEDPDENEAEVEDDE